MKVLSLRGLSAERDLWLPQLMKVDTEIMYKNLKDEVKLTSRICHERIVRLLAACLSDKNRICLIMELVENGNLSRRIHNRNLRKLEYLQVLQVHSQRKQPASLRECV